MVPPAKGTSNLLEQLSLFCIQRPNPNSLTGDGVKADSGIGLLMVNVLESTLECIFYKVRL
jgi:hypothetical protein